MSRGMKISLAVAAVLVAALGLYYGVFRSGPESADLDTASVDATKIPAKTAPRPKRIAAPTPDSAIGGIPIAERTLSMSGPVISRARRAPSRNTSST